jgi:hypothetical protein
MVKFTLEPSFFSEDSKKKTTRKKTAKRSKSKKKSKKKKTTRKKRVREVPLSEEEKDKFIKWFPFLHDLEVRRGVKLLRENEKLLLGLGKDCLEYTNISGVRPDILYDNYAIEIQCSPMSYDLMKKRNKIYLRADKIPVWIFFKDKYFSSKELKKDDKNLRCGIAKSNLGSCEMQIWGIQKNILYFTIDVENKQMAIQNYHIKRGKRNYNFYCDNYEEIHTKEQFDGYLEQISKGWESYKSKPKVIDSIDYYRLDKDGQWRVWNEALVCQSCKKVFYKSIVKKWNREILRWEDVDNKVAFPNCKGCYESGKLKDGYLNFTLQSFNIVEKDMGDILEIRGRVDKYPSVEFNPLSLKIIGNLSLIGFSEKDLHDLKVKYQSSIVKLSKRSFIQWEDGENIVFRYILRKR